jgi:hypothetical protein
MHMGIHQNLTGAQRTARYRASKRAQGLKLKQIWLPDLNAPEVRAAIRADAIALAAQAPKWSDIVNDAGAATSELLDDLFDDSGIARS